MEGGAKIVGVFRVKNHDFTPKIIFFPILGEGGGRAGCAPPPGSAPANGLQSLSSRVDDILFKKHGRWKTDHVKDDYEKENILDRFSVIKS